MKKLFASLALGLSLCFGGAAFAQTAPAADAKVEAKADMKAAKDEKKAEKKAQKADKKADKVAAAPAPVADKK